MADLPPRSVEVDGLLMGPGTPYVVTRIAPGGKPESENGDRRRPRADGVAFGRDQLGGRLISLEVSINAGSYLACQRAWAELSTVFDAERVRTTPESVLPMRVRQFDGATRWVVGRPNRIDPANEELMNLGRLDVVMDFRCIDHKYYSDVEHTETVGIVPASTGGFTFPLTFPLTTFGRAEGEGVITVEGDVAAWVGSTIRGPITSPVVDVAGQWTTELTTQLHDGEYLVVDPQPWQRRVRRNGIVNASGEFTQASPYLSEMFVAPGSYDLTLRGIDATGTASLTTTWRNAFLTL